MRRIRKLRSKQKCSSNQLSPSSDISNHTVTPFGMDLAQLPKTDTKKKRNSEQEKKPRQYQHLCLSERNTIAKMIKKGASLSEISRLLGRGKQTVAAEVSKNGGKESYKARDAQKKAVERKIERDIKCRHAIRNRFINPQIDVLNRLENLEMQMEIIVETIKTLTN